MTSILTSKEHTMTRFILTVLFASLLSAPAYADPNTSTTTDHVYYSWRSGQYKLGSDTLKTDGSVMTYDLDGLRPAYQECLEDGWTGCVIEIGGSSDVNRYDNRGYDPALQGGLATIRASALQDKVNELGDDLYNVSSIKWTQTRRADGWRYSWLKVVPAPGATQGPPIPTDPNLKWGFLNAVLLREADNLCPTLVVADAVTRTYTVQFNDCSCSNYDVNPATAEVEIYSDVAMAQIMRKREKARLAEDLTFTEIREGLQEGATSYVVEVNEELKAEMTSDGLSVDFLETETKLTVRFPDRCGAVMAMQAQAEAEAEAKAEAQAETDRLDAYGPVNGYAGGGLTVGAVTIPAGSPWQMNQGPDLAGNLEAGLFFGGPKFSWKLGGLVGVSHDPNCLLPATIDLGGVTGLSTHRGYNVGFAADIRYVNSSGAYNGTWATNKHRVAIGLGPSIHPGGDRAFLGFNPQVLVGADFVAAETGGGIYTLTERRWVGLGITVYKPF